MTISNYLTFLLWGDYMATFFHVIGIEFLPRLKETLDICIVVIVFFSVTKSLKLAVCKEKGLTFTPVITSLLFGIFTALLVKKTK